MKKKLFTIVMLTCLLVSSCGTQSDGNTYQASKNSAMEENTLLPEASYVENAEKMEDKLSPALQAFKEVLLNERKLEYTTKSFYYPCGIGSDYLGYLNGFEYETPQFTVSDLDGDGTVEVILAIEDSIGYVILRYCNGKVIGNGISYRGFELLKMNGLFMASSGAEVNDLGRLFFLGDSYIMGETVRENWGSYYALEIPTTKEVWEKQYQKYENLPDVEWYDYSERAINQKMMDELRAEENSISSKKVKVIEERQEYLDSLSYLVELSWGRTEEEEETFNKACLNEMKKIYELCLEKFIGEKKDALIDEQSNWEKHGAGVLQRIFHLINVYYDYHFYDWEEIA